MFALALMHDDKFWLSFDELILINLINWQSCVVVTLIFWTN